MAINIRFDLAGNPEPPTIILSKRNGNRLGQLDVDSKSIELSDKLNDASEFSFTLNKYVDGELTNLWDDVVDFKLVYCKEWDMWFEIKVELDEATETIKTVFCTQLGQAELSQIMLYNIEINTEDDIARDDYKITILYDGDDHEASLLHRLLKDKAPHYSIAHVDSTIAGIQRSFSFDDTSLYDAFQEIGEEIGCIFIFDSNTDENGKIRRVISVYDLWQNCLNADCKHRGEFTDVCPECGSRNIKYGYGEDTLIFVTSDELASSGIQLTTDTDSVKNCFKLEAGDDLMTATVRNCNPNGTDYIWRFSDDTKKDMSSELVTKIEEYDELYQEWRTEKTINLDSTLLAEYNRLVDRYDHRRCLDCGHDGYFKDVCPKSDCKSTNIILNTIPDTIVGYSELMNAYYNTVDLELYLKSGLMPKLETSDTNAANEVAKLSTSSLSPVAVSNINAVSLATADNAILSMAKTIVSPTYKVEIKGSYLSEPMGIEGVADNARRWEGNFIVTSYSDDKDTYTKNGVFVNLFGDTEAFVRQKLEKALNKENTDDLSVSGLFKKEIILVSAKDEDDKEYWYHPVEDEDGVCVVENGVRKCDFCEELKKYALNPLISFRDACQACIDILIEQDIGSDKSDELYIKLYQPYYEKLKAIEAEIKIRENEINSIVGIYNSEGDLIQKGLQTDIEEYQIRIQDELDFEKYLGDELWKEFCSYRREDKYTNENYISDGLNNAELFERAREFYEVAENEIYKSSELQHSISTTLNNLLAIPKFKVLVDSFKVGSWIRVQVNDIIYKLRLIEYGIDFSNFNNISVEFSDVTKIKNGITDVESVLSQASSMASSYGSIQRQANQGNKAQNTVSQWLKEGLNTANVRIQSNDNEDIQITKNGLLCRTFDDITQEYSPEQLKLTHNIMAYTDDNWKTVKTAIGKHNYKRYIDKQLVDEVGYGLSAEFVTAGHISGSQIIGGEIYSSNFEEFENGQTKGSYINLLDGTFSFGGGSITFNNDKLTISSPSIKETVDSAINDLDVEGKIEDAVSGLPTQSDVESTVNEAVKDLPTESRVTEITSTAISTANIDASQITTGLLNAERIKGVLLEGNELKAGKITGGSLLIGNKYKLDANGEIVKDDDGNPELSGDNYAEITSDGILNCKGANITGTISGSDIKGGSLLIGERYKQNLWGSTVDGDQFAEITGDGILNCAGANIRGSITASTISGTTINGGTISGASIDSGAFYTTGQGYLGNGSSAYYVCDGSTSNVKGYLSYDSNGSGAQGWNGQIIEAKNRVILNSSSDTVLKLNSGSNMSLEANGYIYMISPTVISEKILLTQLEKDALGNYVSGSFGTELPSTGTDGQLFFVLA